MRTRLTPTLTATTLLALSLSACNEPINPDDLADRVARHAREVVHQSGGGVAFAESNDSGLQKLVDGMNGAGSGITSAMAAPVPPGMMSAMGGSPAAMAMLGMPSMMTTEEQFDETADDIRTWLRERILTSENLESRSDDEAIYLLRPDPTCRALPNETDPVGTIPALDQGCVDDLTRLAVRVALRADGDGGRLTILIGADRLELSQFVVHSDLLAVEVDLAKAYAASKVIDQTLQNESPTPTQFEALAGRLRLAIHKDGERKVTGSFSVLEAITVATIDSNGGLGPDVRLAASNPTLSVTADGVNQTLSVALNIGAVDVRTDWDVMGTAPAPNRDLHVAVGGLYGQATFSEAMDAIMATGLGVGATTVDVRNGRIFDLNLNPNDARKFDLRLSLDPAGHAQADITPRFDLGMGFHYALIAPEYSSPPPSYLLDESYGIKLDNGGAASTVVVAPATDTFNGGVKIAAGTLTISSTGATAPVVVPTGKCLTGLDTAPAGTHPILGALSVVDCPTP